MSVKLQMSVVGFTGGLFFSFAVLFQPSKLVGWW